MKQEGKPARASTSTKNRPRSPSPYRTRPETTAAEFVNEFWQHTITTAENSEEDFKHQALPLARIKKVMKSDPDVKMISSEVTILFEKACQIFIQELTARAHLVSMESRRRTLSRPDVAQAIGKSDMFDFLIDIIPREDAATTTHANEDSRASSVAGGSGSGPSRAKGKGKAKATAGKKRGRKARGDDDDWSDGGTGVAEADADGEQGQTGKRARANDTVGDADYAAQPGGGLQWSADQEGYGHPSTDPGLFEPNHATD